MHFEVQADRPGRHILKIAMVDPTLVLQQIIVSSNGRSSGRPRPRERLGFC